MDMEVDMGSPAKEVEGVHVPPRMSQEINPQNLANLFANEPACNAKPESTAQLSRAMAFAGARIDDEFEMKKLQVFVRIRPTTTDNAAVAAPPVWDAANCIHASSQHTLAIAPPEGSMSYKSGDRGQTFVFSQVFEAATTQEEYFSGTAAPLVTDLLRNPQHNSVMMAYGITAAGKTYTIEGNKTAPGVLPRALSALFAGLDDHIDGAVLAVRVSYCEIYNEAVYDLLEDTPVGFNRQRPALRVMEDPSGRVCVAGLSEVEVTTAEEALSVLRRGAKHRQRAETGLNYGSSRSHSIFGIQLVRKEAVIAGGEECEESGEAEATVERLGRMAFVDLAGSERAQRTGNVGIRLKESVAINSSLMTLGRCLEALRWNQQQTAVAHVGGASAPLKVVPFRESKVTHLFRDAFHGYGRVVLSVNVSPCAKDYDETAHVLRYASLATGISTLQQAEAPRRTIKAVTPEALRRAKRRAAAKAAKEEERAKKAKAIAEVKAKHAEKIAARVEAVAAGKAAAMEERKEQHEASAAQPQQQREMNSIPSTEATTKMEVCSIERSKKLEARSRAIGEDDDVMDEDAAMDADSDGDFEEEHDLEANGDYSEGEAEESDEEEEEEILVYEVMNNNKKGLVNTATQDHASPPSAAASPMQEERVDGGSSDVPSIPAEVVENLLEEDNIISAPVVAEASPPGAVPYRLETQSPRECSATPATPFSEQYDEQDSEAVAVLQAQVQELIKALQAAEERAVLLEGEVREEVAGEMAGLLKDMEESYKQRMVAEVAAAEARAVAGGNNGKEKRKGGKSTYGGKRPKSAASSGEDEEGRGEAEDRGETASADALANAEAEIAALRAELELQHAEARQQAERVARAEEAAHAARFSVEAAALELAAAQAKAEWLAAALAETRRRSEEVVEDRLREEVTQLGANAAMELEMAEQQSERLRKENMALRQQLAMAMATLETVASPSVSILQRMAAACPSGAGCGAAGTPHEVALARARQAAAAEEAAAAAEMQSGCPLSAHQQQQQQQRSTGPRTTTTGPQRSRFAEEALAMAALASQPEVTGCPQPDLMLCGEASPNFAPTPSTHNLQEEDQTPEEDIRHEEVADEMFEHVEESVEEEVQRQFELVPQEVDSGDGGDDDLDEMEEQQPEVAAVADMDSDKIAAEEDDNGVIDLVGDGAVQILDCTAEESPFAAATGVTEEPEPEADLEEEEEDDVLEQQQKEGMEMEEYVEGKNEEIVIIAEGNTEQYDFNADEAVASQQEEAAAAVPVDLCKLGEEEVGVVAGEAEDVQMKEEEEPVNKALKKLKRRSKRSKGEDLSIVLVQGAADGSEIELGGGGDTKRRRRGRSAAAAEGEVEKVGHSAAAPLDVPTEVPAAATAAAAPESAECVSEKVAAKLKGRGRGKRGQSKDKLLEERKDKGTTAEDDGTANADEDEAIEGDCKKPGSRRLRTRGSTATKNAVQRDQEELEVAEVGLPRLRRQRSKAPAAAVAVLESVDEDAPLAVLESIDRDSSGAESQHEEEEEEKPRRRVTRRSSRAPLKSTTTSNPRKGSAGETAAGATKGRKRRLLQPSKPLSAHMRSALGELAEAELPSAPVMPLLAQRTPAKSGASMGEMLGLTPARRQGSPKRTRRQTTVRQLEEFDE